MATLYYDSVSGTAGGAGTKVDPKQTLPTTGGWTQDNIYLIKDGTTQTLSGSAYFGPNQTGIVIGSYTDDEDYAGTGILHGGTTSATYVVRISNNSITIRGVQIVSSGGRQNGINVASNAGVGYTGTKIYDNTIVCGASSYTSGIACNGYPTVIDGNTIKGFFIGVNFLYLAEGGGTPWASAHSSLRRNTIRCVLPTANLTKSATKSGAYTVEAADNGTTFTCDGTWTLALLAVGTAGAGFCFKVANAGSGTITINPDGAETINGSSTLAITAGCQDTVVCSGTAWITYGSSDGVSNTLGGATAPIDLASLTIFSGNDISGFSQNGIDFNVTKNAIAIGNTVHDDAGYTDYSSGFNCGSQEDTGGGVNNKVLCNTIYNMTGSPDLGALGLQARCGYTGGDQNLEVSGNLFYNINGPCILNNAGAANKAVANKYRFNTLVSSSGYGIDISAGTGHVITSNVISCPSNRSAILVRDGYSATHTLNVEYGGAAATLGAGTLTDGGGNVTSNPGLNASYAVGNEAVKATSAFIPGILALDQLAIPLRPDPGAVQDRNAADRRFGIGGGNL